MKKSTHIPEKGPLRIVVKFFGYFRNMPEVIATVNESPELRFNKKLGKWFDADGNVLTEEAQGYLERIWASECERTGLRRE